MQTIKQGDIMNNICEYGIKDKRKITCIKDRQLCGYFRYCRTKMKPIMIEKYINCKWRNDMVKEKNVENDVFDKGLDLDIYDTDVVEVELKEIKKPKNSKKIKTKKCKVLFETKGKILVELLGQNIRLKNNKNYKSGDFVDVKYVGEIGNKDFAIIEE